MLTIGQHLRILFLKSRFKPINSAFTSLLNVLCELCSPPFQFSLALLWLFNSKTCACYGKLTSLENNKYTKIQSHRPSLLKETRWVGGREAKRSILLKTSRFEGNTDLCKQDPPWKTWEPPRLPESEGGGLKWVPPSFAVWPSSPPGSFEFAALCLLHTLSILDFMTHPTEFPS